MSRRSVVNLGILGVPPDWDDRYVEALAALGSRIRVLSVFDSQPCRARMVARAAGASAIFGVRALIGLPRLDAILYLGWGWQREWAADICFSAGTPVFVGQQVLRSSADWEQTFGSVRSETLSVPETLLRYRPVMLRLRELMATNMGPVRDVWISLPRAQHVVDGGLSLREVTHWFWSLCGASALSGGQNREGLNQEIRLQAQTKAGAELTLVVQTVEVSGPTDSTSPFAIVECDRGTVELLGSRELRWSCKEGGQTLEKLHSDRSATQVVLDLFIRRVAGGLIPVPALSDLIRAQHVAEHAASIV